MSDIGIATMLTGKNIILTGAGRGIGRVVAERCAKEGAMLALLARTESELEGTLKRIKDLSPDSFYLVCDVSGQSWVKKVFREIKTRWDHIDVLINNAGVQWPIGPFHANKLRAWKANVETNLFGMAHCTHHVLKDMIHKGKGKIINLSGGGSTSARGNFSAYAVSKTAIVRFTETLAEELRKFNIDVNAIAPGAINTKMLDEVIEAEELAGKELADALKRKVHGGNDPGLAADLICFLASERSNGITGKLISAPWDLWRNEEFCEKLRTDRDLGTLRRIDDKHFTRKT